MSNERLSQPVVAHIDTSSRTGSSRNAGNDNSGCPSGCITALLQLIAAGGIIAVGVASWRSGALDKLLYDITGHRPTPLEERVKQQPSDSHTDAVKQQERISHRHR